MHAHNFYILSIRDGFMQQWKKTTTVTERRLVRYNLLIASINLTYGQTKFSQSNKRWLHAMHFSLSVSANIEHLYRLWFLLTSGIDCLEQFTILACLFVSCCKRILFYSLLLHPLLFPSLMYTLHALVLYELCSVSKNKEKSNAAEHSFYASWYVCRMGSSFLHFAQRWSVEISFSFVQFFAICQFVMCAWAKHTHSTTISIDQFTIIKWKIDVPYTSALDRGKTQKKIDKNKKYWNFDRSWRNREGKNCFCDFSC